MIRLKEYLKPAKYQKVIEEKVSKKDIESAWKDKHVRLGAEFEYYDNDISEFDGGTNFENALDEYNELERRADSKRKELEAANEEYESGVRQELEDAISEKKDAINYEDDEDTKDDLQKELDDLERWLDDGDMQSFKELYGEDYYDGLNQVFDDVMMYNYPTVEYYDNYVEYLQMYGIDLHGGPGFPFAQTMSGARTEGEIYKVSTKVLKRLDQLEGHPDWYIRKSFKIGNLKKVWIYLNPEEAKLTNQIKSGRWENN